MNRLDHFSNCLDVLKKADFSLADDNTIYRMGIVCQSSLTFELAWKALKMVLCLHGAKGAETGSPREILQIGYQLGFINDTTVWRMMLKKHHSSVDDYNDEDTMNEMVLLIHDSFLPAFTALEKTLREKLSETGTDWN